MTLTSNETAKGKTKEENSKMTGGQAAVEALRQENVDHVFGLIGSATMELFDALYDANDINFIGVRDERTGTHMADAYARVSGKNGVILAGQNGPGATNLVTGLAQAKHAFSPVLAIAGGIKTEHLYKDAFQEVDQQSLFTPITKKTWTINQTERIPEMFREAFRVSQSGRKGPVAINIPRDVLSGMARFENYQTPSEYRTEFDPGGNPEAIEQAINLLSKAKRPLIIAGGGVKWGKSHLLAQELAEKLNAPIAAAAGHGDVIPNNHELYAGQVGPRGNVIATMLAQEADVILALGTRLGFNSTFYSYDNLNKDACIIQVDIESTAIGRYFPINIGITGDAGTVTKQFNKHLSNHAISDNVVNWTKEFQRKRKDFLTQRDIEGNDLSLPIKPKTVFTALRNVLPEDVIVTLDAGTLCLQATDSLNVSGPTSLITPLDFGLVGFSYAAGLGAKLASPDRTVVSLMGDGGFGMTMSEIGTAVEAGINTVAIVLNNHCWGAEKAYQRDFFNKRYIGADVPNPRFDEVAKLFGAEGYRVDHAEDIESTIKKAIESGKPTVVDIQIDPDALYSFRKDSFQHRIKED